MHQWIQSLSMGNNTVSKQKTSNKITKKVSPEKSIVKNIPTTKDSKLELHIKRDNIEVVLPKKTHSQWYIGAGNLLITVVLFLVSRKLIKSDKVKERSHDSQLFLFQKSLFPMSDKTLSHINNVNNNFHSALTASQKTTSNSEERRELIEDYLNKAEELQNTHVSEELSKSLIFNEASYTKLSELEETFSDTHQVLLSKIPSSTLSNEAIAELITLHNNSKREYQNSTNDYIKESQPKFD